VKDKSAIRFVPFNPVEFILSRSPPPPSSPENIKRPFSLAGRFAFRGSPRYRIFGLCVLGPPSFGEVQAVALLLPHLRPPFFAWNYQDTAPIFRVEANAEGPPCNLPLHACRTLFRDADDWRVPFIAHSVDRPVSAMAFIIRI